ncbi:MAG: hypothetical protein KDI07_17420 [Anaerolineae bacterium]|nr:hypothetical protein [Anaerolineae bacterium]MCB0234925.1 hypothetical protein [Anaerolineae bacterium]MCB0239674.1 hypothetical protein [Anaerolineae bacterium]MCB0242631.1 hypothetical protein [Anaerolineae bacterium]MCB0250358.1 hypothetical protein [Anaerolineae bacterium]
MKIVQRLLAGWLVSALLVGATVTAAASSSTPPTPGDASTAEFEKVAENEWVWTNWVAGQYALADDGEAIWVGTSMGLLRWDKAANKYERITAFEGFPQSHVYAVAVDSGGNRWFGGNGGLSRLDSHDHWTHYTSANSGLHAGAVDGIAVEADGTVWASHGLPDGAVSRLAPDGTWRQFPNRSAAIITDYADILSTRNLNRLWLVTGDEVWMGYWVYDGHGWMDRLPDADHTRALNADGTPLAPYPEPMTLDKDSTGRVWALVNSQQMQSWSGAAWVEQTPDLCDNQLSTLNVGPDDTVWIGYVYSESTPFGIIQCSGITPSPPPAAFCPLVYPCVGAVSYEPPAATYVSTEGVWAVGPDWFKTPDGWVADTNVHPDVTHLLMHQDGTLWMRLASSAIQTLQDHASGQLNDDQAYTIGWVSQLSGWTVLPGGDVFVVWYSDAYHGPYPGKPKRWHEGRWIEYDPPMRTAWFTIDVFAQDDDHIWFAAVTRFGDATAVIELDDNGTPAELTDDTWTVLDAGQIGITGVAVDALGRIWLSAVDGVYIRSGDSWEHIVQGDPVCTLVPAADGIMLALACGDDWRVTIIDEAGNQIDTSLVYLFRDHFDLVRTTTRPNPRWSVAPDGGVWVIFSVLVDKILRRYDETGYRQYDLPALRTANLVAGPDNRVWLTADGILWRMSPQPDYDLSAIQGVWPVTPGSEISYRFPLRAVDGFNLPVTLEAAGLPPEITTSFAPNPVIPGSTVTMTIESSLAATPGSFPAPIQASSDAISHTLDAEITVFPELQPLWLPMLRMGN